MRTQVRVAMLAAVTLLSAAGQAPGELKVRNTYRYLGRGQYQWTIFLSEDQRTLDRINCVEYTLHPTFPNPVRRVCGAAGGFPLTAEGWGEFPLTVKIEWKDGHATRQQYSLDLHSPPATVQPPTPPAPALGPIRTGNTARALGGGQWAWTVYISADENTLGRIQCVQYTLHPTFPNPIQRVCQRGGPADAAFPFSAQGWGTFDVGIKVELRDGGALYLKHTLKFQPAGEASIGK
ncbi:MAG: pYEATS domain-containing protein [Bryobacteraceae bacterium]